MLGFETVPSVSEPPSAVLPTVPWEPLEFLTNVSKFIKHMARHRVELGPTA